MIRVLVTLLPANDGAEPSRIATMDLSAVGERMYRGEVRFAHSDPPIRVLLDNHERRPFGWVPLVRRMLQAAELTLEGCGLLTKEGEDAAKLYDDVAQPLQSLLLNTDVLRNTLRSLVQDSADVTRQGEALALLSDIDEASARIASILRARVR